MPGIGSFTRERTPRSAAAEPGAAPLNAKQQAMVRSVMALVRKFARARRRRSPGVAYDELVAVGYQVLVELAPRYDETRGPFAVFATFRVKGAMLKYVRATLEQRGAEREIRAGSSRTMRTRGMDLLTGKPDDEQIDGLELSMVDGVASYLGDTNDNYIENEQVERLHREQVAMAAGAFIETLTERDATIFKRHLLENASFPDIANQLSMCSRTALRVFERVSLRLREHLLRTVLI